MHDDSEYENLSKMIEYGNYSLFEDEVKRMLDTDPSGASVTIRRLYFDTGPIPKQLIVNIFNSRRKEKLYGPSGLYSEKVELITDLVKSFSSTNKKNYYIVCPTGWGKTTFAEGLIDSLYLLNKKQRFLFIVSRNNVLLEQTASRFMFPDMVRYCGTVASWEKQQLNNARVVIASLQSVVGRVKEDDKLIFSIKNNDLHPNQFNLIIIDEIHNFIDNLGEHYLDYQREEINFGSKDTIKLGLTATPYQGVKGKEKYVRDIDAGDENFGKPFIHIPLIREINRGRLSKIEYCTYKPTQKVINVDEDVDGDLKFKPTQNNERSQATVELYTRFFSAKTFVELKEAFEDAHIVLKHEADLPDSADKIVDIDGVEYCIEKTNERICAFTKYHKKKAIFFCVDQNHARYTHGLLQQKGIRSECVTADIGQNVGEVSNMIKCNKLDAIVAVNRVTEGFDLPEIEVIFLLRPTLSARLYLQQIGRGLRISKEKGKHTLLIADIVGNYLKHGKRIDALTLEEVLKKTDGMILEDSFDEELKNAVKFQSIEKQDMNTDFANLEVFSEKDENRFFDILNKIFPNEIQRKIVQDKINTETDYCFYSSNFNYVINKKDSGWQLYIKVPCQTRDDGSHMISMDNNTDKHFSKRGKLQIQIKGIRERIAYTPEKEDEFSIGTLKSDPLKDAQEKARETANAISQAYMSFMAGEGITEINGIPIISQAACQEALKPELDKLHEAEKNSNEASSKVQGSETKKGDISRENIPSKIPTPSSQSPYSRARADESERIYSDARKKLHIERATTNQNTSEILKNEKIVLDYLALSRNREPRLKITALSYSSRSRFSDAKRVVNMISDVGLHDRVACEIIFDLCLEKKFNIAETFAVMIHTPPLRNQMHHNIASLEKEKV